MARLIPKPSTIKKLYAFSGNKCALPNCSNKLIENDSILGEICHIEAAEVNGPRFNPNSDDEYRRSTENLILLCERDHKIIDNNQLDYPVELLKQLKIEHESKYKDAVFDINEYNIEKSIKKFMEQKNTNTGSGVQINNIAETQNIGTQIGTQHVYNYPNDINENQVKTKIEGVRKPIPSLKAIIDKEKQKASPPDKTVIDFRSDLSERHERDVMLIPINFLKFRKANGRIKSDVESYEKTNNIILIEETDEAQIILRGFLSKNDPEKKEILKKQLMKKGQQQPAIITCDGFLINGNRRKMILDELFHETNQNPIYQCMRVVILPENVTELDIRKIENRYQLQDEGKSEYSGLNRALTIRDNIRGGYDLRAQLYDDPKSAGLDKKEFEKKVKELEKEYLEPLECVDRYLRTFNRQELYNTISESTGDKEGRWQAFIDYSAFYNSTLIDDSKRQELGIAKEEVMKIDNSILKIIRKRDLNSPEIEKALGKVHAFVRGGNLKKYLSNPTAKKHLIKIAEEVNEDIPERDKYDKNNNRYSEREIDERWSNQFKGQILGKLMMAYKAVYSKGERDKPLDLLEDALKKLNHDNLQIDNMGIEHFEKALDLVKKISEKADQIYKQIDNARYKLKKLNK